MTGATNPVQYYLARSDNCEIQNGEIIVEASVSLTVNGAYWLTFMCTPVDLEELAVGFLFNEGLINSAREIADVRLCDAGNNIDLWTSHAITKPEAWRKTSGCTGGITSVPVENAIHKQQTANGSPISINKVLSLVDELFESQMLYKIAGGVHTSILTDGEGTIITAEDIGRHNTLDKIAGKLLFAPKTHKQRIILTTGRISSEMLQKSNRIGASIVISRTSPSSLSVQMAKDLNITIIGYAKRGQFRIYTHPERIYVDERKIQVIQENKGSAD